MAGPYNTPTSTPTPKPRRRITLTSGKIEIGVPTPTRTPTPTHTPTTTPRPSTRPAVDLQAIANAFAPKNNALISQTRAFGGSEEQVNRVRNRLAAESGKALRGAVADAAKKFNTDPAVAKQALLGVSKLLRQGKSLKDIEKYGLRALVSLGKGM